MYLWITAAFIAYFIKGLCGFANTLVLTTILSFGASNADISPVDLLLGYPMNLILTWKNRRCLDPKIWGPLAALVLAGSIPGACWQHPRRAPAEKCGRESHKGGVWCYSGDAGHRDAFTGIQREGSRSDPMEICKWERYWTNY